MGYLDVLVPPAPDPRDLIELLRNRTVRDAGVRVELGPLDEATFHLVTRAIERPDGHLWLELPRGRHDLAVMVGLYLQLLRRGERMQGRFTGIGFAGPVVVVGLNTNLTERLHRIKIGPQSLSDAVGAQRVRTDGQVIDLKGTISPARAWDDGLFYLNTSLGWPRLRDVKAGAVVIDRTSFRNPETLDRALAWAKDHLAERIVVLGDLADRRGTHADDPCWVWWSWTPPLLADVIHELGTARPCSTLSTNVLLNKQPQPAGLALYQAPALSAARRRALAGITRARRAGAEFPRPLADCTRLVNALSGLWGSLRSYNEWSVLDPWAMPIATLAHTVRTSRSDDLHGQWRTFAETGWADLRQDALTLHELLEEYNPRLDMLLGVLDWAAQERPDARVTVRTHTRAGVQALTQDLLERRPGIADDLAPFDAGHARLQVLPYNHRQTWSSAPSLEIHLGVPSPWRRSSLVSAEASEHIVVLDDDERSWLERVITGLVSEWATTAHRADHALQLGGTPDLSWTGVQTVIGPLALDTRGVEDELDDVTMPSIDLARLFLSFGEAVDVVEHSRTPGDDPSVTVARGRSVLARPVTLEPGNFVYWVPADGRTEVVAGDRYATVAASDLSSGMSILIPRGETRDDLYQRLQQAAHRDADVMAVSMLLAKFRSAVHQLHDHLGSWDDVARALRTQGSSVTSGQACRLWAVGDVIAPEDVEDIRRVGWLTKNPALSTGGAPQRLGAMADELRRLHRELGRLLSAAIAEAASGRTGPTLRRLSEVCGGIDTAEVLEEFELRQIRYVGPPAPIPIGQLRRRLPAPTDH